MTAIYQQARPYTFDQVIGQEHVKDVLVAALNRGRLGHAYLFSGPRGVGKTTTARLIAMAVNCEAADDTQKPCGVCASCTLVRQNSHPDVIELDAASNNSVEDVRDLRDKVRLASMRGGKRVWVLDEAHMLSRAAANALLKTLEEPPENLVFVLATTEPEKLPPTILSRCQHFRFRRLAENEIEQKLTRLCEQANVTADKDALSLVARAADGAMRDGESLLERLLTTGEHISRQDAEKALGLPPQERLEALANNLLGGQLESLFSACSELYHDGFSPRSLAEHLSLTLRDLLVGMVSGEASLPVDVSEADLLRVIHALDDESERFVRRDDLFSLEVTLIKTMNALQRNVPSDAQVAVVQGAPAQTSHANAAAPAKAAQASALPDFDPLTPVQKQRPRAAEPAASKPAPVASEKRIDWSKIKTRASAQLKAFLMPAQDEIDGQQIVLRYGEKHSFHFGQLKQRQAELIELIASVYGSEFDLTIEGPGETIRKKG